MFFMRMINGKGIGLTMMNLRSQPPKLSFIKDKIRCVYDGITVVFFVFVNRNQTINTDLYSQQLQRVKENFKENSYELFNKRNVLVLHVTTSWYSARITAKKKKLDFGWTG